MPQRFAPVPQRFAPALVLAALSALGVACASAPHMNHSGHGASQATPTAPSTTSSATSPLRVVSGTVVAVPPGIKETAAFLVLSNPTDQPVTLRAASTPVAGRATLMVTTRTGEMSGMKAVPTLTVPARGTLKMGHLGDHVMLMGLKRPLKVGETLSITLTDSAGRTLNVAATVRKP